jgi:signal transduction histidine kinase
MDLLGTAADDYRAAADESGIDITLCPSSASLVLRCDRRHVELALGNLVENSVKFTPAGGVVTIGAEVVGGDVHLWVKDTGPGIAGAESTHVFDRFYRGAAAASTGAEGNGLGLAIVQAVAVAHHGSARVESPHEGGSRFVIVLPANGPTGPAGPPDPPTRRATR